MDKRGVCCGHRFLGREPPCFLWELEGSPCPSQSLVHHVLFWDIAQPRQVLSSPNKMPLIYSFRGIGRNISEESLFLMCSCGASFQWLEERGEEFCSAE